MATHEVEVVQDDTPGSVEIELPDGTIMSFTPLEAMGIATQILEAVQGALANG